MLGYSRILRAPTQQDHQDGGDLSLPRLHERIYRGERRHNGVCSVWVEDRADDGATIGLAWRELPLHLKIRAHSPTGFAWGYGGSGPAQLALALLVDALGDRELAERQYQAFKWNYVCKWGETWTITASEIRAFVSAQEHSSASES